MESREYDIVVYGASGFTGQFVALQVLVSCMEGKNLKWAVGGRNRAKLEKLLSLLKEETGSTRLDEVGILEADVSDYPALLTVCGKAKVVINCVGPFRLFGEPVVKACVEAGTNYVDVSGEPEFLEKMQLNYHEEAAAKGVHIVGSCGFDSLPSDVGLEHLREKFPGELTSAEVFINYYGRPKGNFTTYESMVLGIGAESNLKPIRKKLFSERMTYLGPKLKRHEKEKRYTLPFQGADPSVVRRTQYFLCKNYGKTPIQFSAYLCMQNLLQLLALMVFGTLLLILSKFKAGRSLLLAYPEIFTFGTFSKNGLTRKELDERSCSLTFYGQGYSTKPDVESSKNKKPDKSMMLRIAMPEMGYVATPICVVQAVLVILEDDLQNKGGVLTPGAAFTNTSIVNRLIRSGFVFKFDPEQ